MSEKKKWSVASAVITGLSHLAENTPCQDKVAVTPVRSGVNYYAAALADGVGSLKNSHIAASVATRAALAWLTEHRAQLFAEQSKEKEAERLKNLAAMMLEKIRHEIREQAELQGMDVRSMDCNLAFCFVDEEREKAFVGQLGDCAVCIVCDDSDKSRSRVLNQQGMLANSTDTVWSKGSEDRVNLCVIPVSQKGLKGNRLLYGFILTSDGLENVLYRKGSKYVCKQAEYCFNLDNTNRDGSLRELLTDAQESSRGYLDDDLSVVVLSCVDGPVSLPKEPYWICRACGAENLGLESRCHKCGSEMLSMFPEADIEKAGSAEAYFEWLNRKNGAGSTAARNAGVGKNGNQNRKNTSKNKTNGKTSGTIDTSTEEDEGLPDRRRPSDSLAWIGGSLKDGGVSAESGNTGNGYDSTSVYKKEYRRDASTGERRSGLVTKILVVVLISAVICMMAQLILMCIKVMNPNGTVVSTEPGSILPTDNVETEPNQPAGEGVRLEDGMVFFGRMIDGRPDGWGALIDEENNKVYSGYFLQGEMEGVFTVTTYEDFQVVASIVFYQNGVVTDVYYGEAEESGRDIATVAHDVQLYVEPSYESKPAVDETGRSMRLRKEDTVYLIDESTDDNDNRWCQIETVDGVIGWCEGAAIHRIIHEDAETSADQEIQDGIIYHD